MISIIAVRSLFRRNSDNFFKRELVNCISTKRFYNNTRNFFLNRPRKMLIKVALIDLSGTLHVEDDPTPGAVEALKSLRQSEVHVRFVTNTTKESKETLFNRLIKIGFELDQNEICSSLSAASTFVTENQLNPLYLLSEDARKDFPSNSNENYDSVLIGLAPKEFYYENMNKAFNVLIKNKNHKLIATHKGKYYKRTDGLALGPGCFVKGLEYAANTEAIVIGKPNKYFYESAIPKGVKFNECVMIGDDPIADIAGALEIGMLGILVKTGKYLPEVVVEPPPTVLVENFADAVTWIKKNNEGICLNSK